MRSESQTKTSRQSQAEENFKAGLDLECPIDLPGLQEAIKEVREASAF